ncbi:MAG TPA: ribokinase [Clostridia bacterium]|jgi:ribokinase
MADITVIGSFVMDMVASVEEFPLAGQTILGKSLSKYPGGKGANQCVAMARLGADAEMIGMLGGDENGRIFRELLKSEGIKTDNIFETHIPTAVAQIQVNNKGENKIVVIPSANFEFGFEHLKQIESVIAKTKLVVLQLELRLDVTYEIIRTCHRLGAPVILNPAPAVRLDEDILRMVDYLTPNETELAVLTQMPTNTQEEVFAAADKLLDIGVKNVIATLGSRGALIATRESKKIISGYKVQAVDTVAAGDSFNGALAKCIAEGKPLEDAVKFANAVGALTVTKRGAIPSLPKLGEVEEFIKNCKNH